MEAQFENIQEMLKKEIEDLKNKQTEVQRWTTQSLKYKIHYKEPVEE